MAHTKNKHYGNASWVGLLGSDDGEVILSISTDDDDEADHEYTLSPGNCQWLYDLLGSFCR